MVQDYIEDAQAWDAASLLERLTRIYTSYTAQSENQRKPKYGGVTRLFRRWFSGFDPLSVGPVHQAFLDDVGETAALFAAALETLNKHDSKSSMDYAAKAADVMMTPKPAGEKTTEQWYLTVAEYHIASVLPYLSCGGLERVREGLLKSAPKRLMYPRQRELFDLVEKLIQDSTQET